VDQAEALRLRRLLSQARIGEYAAVCGGDTVAALRLFCWNTEIAGGLYGPLQHLELSLRSVMDQQLRRLFERADWWDAPTADLHFAARQKITDARGQLRRQAIPPHHRKSSTSSRSGSGSACWAAATATTSVCGAPRCTELFRTTADDAGIYTKSSTTCAYCVTRSLTTPRSTTGTCTPTMRRSWKSWLT
jgi:hypothetical protein